MKKRIIGQSIFSLTFLQYLKCFCIVNCKHTLSLSYLNMIFCAIWYHLYNLKNVKNTHGGVKKTNAEACNVTKSNTPPWVFFTLFKLYKWYQFAQRITNMLGFRKDFSVLSTLLPVEMDGIP